jgi:peptide/nickel transport system substrate-binding protein
MFGPSPHSVWDGKDLIDMIGPLWGEPDEAKRIAGYKAVAKHIAEEGEVIPLLQYVQPIIVRKGLTLVPQASGQLLPQTVTGS